jgi:type III pantothenate kinase
MKLVIDIGNTNIKFGLFDKHQIKKMKIIPTKKYQVLPDFQNVETCCIGSVVLKLNTKIYDDIYHKYHIVSKIVTIQDFKKQFNLSRFKKQNEMGLDILAFALLIKSKYQSGIGISFGTATFAVAINDNIIHGVAIAPAFTDSLNQLSKKTALIKNANLGKICFSLGNDTKSALSSGIAHVVNGFIQSITSYCQKQYGVDCVYITGGKSD